VEELVTKRLAEIEDARAGFLHWVDALTDLQGRYKPRDDAWSAQEITEHLVLAERMGVHFVWRAADASKQGEPLWAGNHDNRGLRIEEIVRRTWREREVAPDPATPTGEGSLSLWSAELRALTGVTGALGQRLEGENLEAIVYPHFLSGPLDADQRLQFIGFHMSRHASQAESLLSSEGFPD